MSPPGMRPRAFGQVVQCEGGVIDEGGGHAKERERERRDETREYSRMASAGVRSHAQASERSGSHASFAPPPLVSVSSTVASSSFTLDAYLPALSVSLRLRSPSPPTSTRLYPPSPPSTPSAPALSNLNASPYAFSTLNSLRTPPLHPQCVNACPLRLSPSPPLRAPSPPLRSPFLRIRAPSPRLRVYAYTHICVFAYPRICAYAYLCIRVSVRPQSPPHSPPPPPTRLHTPSPHIRPLRAPSLLPLTRSHAPLNVFNAFRASIAPSGSRRRHQAPDQHPLQAPETHRLSPQYFRPSRLTFTLYAPPSILGGSDTPFAPVLTLCVEGSLADIAFFYSSSPPSPSLTVPYLFVMSTTPSSSSTPPLYDAETWNTWLIATTIVDPSWPAELKAQREASISKAKMKLKLELLVYFKRALPDGPLVPCHPGEELELMKRHHTAINEPNVGQATIYLSRGLSKREKKAKKQERLKRLKVSGATAEDLELATLESDTDEEMEDWDFYGEDPPENFVPTALKAPIPSQPFAIPPNVAPIHLRYPARTPPNSTGRVPLPMEVRYSGYVYVDQATNILCANTTYAPILPPSEDSTIYVDGYWGRKDTSLYPQRFDHHAPWLLYIPISHEVLRRPLLPENRRNLWTAGMLRSGMKSTPLMSPLESILGPLREKRNSMKQTVPKYFRL
ncbi:uncharacterized protein STEHIDRAFT_163738, partial [Stereum hirsutum FP-91666 SS1]